LITLLKMPEASQGRGFAFTGFWHFDRINMAVQRTYTLYFTLPDFQAAFNLLDNTVILLTISAGNSIP